MDLVFIILIIILCVLIAFYVKNRRNLKSGGWFGQRRIIGADPKVGGGKEIEARWLDIDVDDMRKKIEELGGELVHDEKQYRRYVFALDADTADVKIEGKKDCTLSVGDQKVKTKNKEKECKDFVKAVRSKGNGYVRTREEYRGNDVVVTMTCKLYPKDKSGKTKHADEYELETENTLEECRDFLLAIGVPQKAYHETRRIKYKVKNGKLKGVHEIALDTIPGLPQYIEIEAKNEKTMFDAAKALGLEKGKEHYGAYGKTFAELYGMSREWVDDELDRLDFETFHERLLPKIEKNKEIFEQIVKKFSLAVSDSDSTDEELEEVGDDSDEEQHEFPEGSPELEGDEEED